MKIVRRTDCQVSKRVTLMVDFKILNYLGSYAKEVSGGQQKLGGARIKFVLMAGIVKLYSEILGP